MNSPWTFYSRLKLTLSDWFTRRNSRGAAFRSKYRLFTLLLIHFRIAFVVVISWYFNDNGEWWNTAMNKRSTGWYRVKRVFAEGPQAVSISPNSGDDRWLGQRIILHGWGNVYQKGDMMLYQWEIVQQGRATITDGRQALSKQHGFKWSVSVLVHHLLLLLAFYSLVGGITL